MSVDYFLRELSREDKESINGWRNDKDLVDLLGSPFRYIDQSVDSAWMESYFSNRSNNVRLAICNTANKKIVGVIYLISIDWVSKNCELAILIGDTTHRGKGVGTFAIKSALRHAFLDLNLHRVYLTALEDNRHALNLYRKVGFTNEGTHKESIYKNGKYLNMIQMALLKSEYIPDVIY